MSRGGEAAAPARKKRKKSAQQQQTSSADGDASEAQYLKMGSEFVSLSMQILALCVGQTTKELLRAMDPDASRRLELHELVHQIQREEEDEKGKRDKAS